MIITHKDIISFSLRFVIISQPTNCFYDGMGYLIRIYVYRYILLCYLLLLYNELLVNTKT